MEKVADRLEQPWWRNAAVYQVYLRSYKDSDGDGNGDLNGLRMELKHIAELGCDALWLNPIYLSPQRDHGYDIADYRSIDPMYGTLDDFDCLVAEAHELGLRVIMDVVPNHCSDQHPWFQQALASNDGGPERSRFIIERGEGQTGAQVPNGWQSVFGDRRGGLFVATLLLPTGIYIRSMRRNRILTGETLKCVKNSKAS